jgi:hypothetical protein
MDFFQKAFSGVFELPLLRNARQHHFFFFNLPTSFGGYLPDARRFLFVLIFSLAAPSAKMFLVDGYCSSS